MSQQHNYINPAFCQQSEFYPSSSKYTTPTITTTNYSSPVKVHRSESIRSVASTSMLRQQQLQQITKHKHSLSFNEQFIQQTSSPQRIKTVDRQQQQQPTPPRPGPKPQVNLNSRYGPLPLAPTTITNEFIPAERDNSSQGYALVPLADIPNTDKGRYAYIPAKQVNLIRSASTRQIAKSQDSLQSINDEFHDDDLQQQNGNDGDNSFKSLPPCLSSSTSFPAIDSSSPHLKSAFSSDFNNKSMILVDQNSMQRYEIVPTEEDEDIVDANSEIIQMHNGRVHRYAVIPTTDDEETCLSSEFDLSPVNDKYATIKEAPAYYRQQQQQQQQYQKQQQHTKQQQPHPKALPPKPKMYTSSPQKRSVPSTTTSISNIVNSEQTTPSKNSIATQKLFEILSTPQKTPQQYYLNRQANMTKSFTGGTPPSHNRSHRTNNHQRYHSQIIASSTPKQSEFVPQKLHYESQMINTTATSSQYEQQQQQQHQLQEQQQQLQLQQQQQQQRTTAIIAPRLSSAVATYSARNARSMEAGLDKSFTSDIHKVSQATATIGAVSLMLILGGAMNSGLCLYMISVFGRLYYLDISIVSGFAAVGLGLLGFKSRHCDWLPNRNYISGYILVTVFSLLNCSGLLVLLAMRPLPGSAIYDVTTGCILGLSSLMLLVISLGVITSRWCRAPPPDNRVDVHNY